MKTFKKTPLFHIDPPLAESLNHMSSVGQQQRLINVKSYNELVAQISNSPDTFFVQTCRLVGDTRSSQLTKCTLTLVVDSF